MGAAKTCNGTISNNNISSFHDNNHTLNASHSGRW